MTLAEEEMKAVEMAIHYKKEDIMNLGQENSDSIKPDSENSNPVKSDVVNRERENPDSVDIIKDHDESQPAKDSSKTIKKDEEDK